MLQEPYGCFEQTTSTTWPNVLVMSYMLETGQIAPEIQMKAESLISAGYQRLLTFEHPGGRVLLVRHTGIRLPTCLLPPFGLMEFADMTEVHDIDDTLVPRTAQWLASQQQTDGSFEGDQTEFFSFHTSKLRNTAFVTWGARHCGATPVLKSVWGSRTSRRTCTTRPLTPTPSASSPTHWCSVRRVIPPPPSCSASSTR